MFPSRCRGNFRRPCRCRPQRYENEELAGKAAEIDKELRDKAKGIFNDANMDEDEDENLMATHPTDVNRLMNHQSRL